MNYIFNEVVPFMQSMANDRNGWTGTPNQWVIDRLTDRDVLVVDMYDKIYKGTFLGGNNMTRQELVTMIYRFADYLGKDVTATADLGKLFSDAGEINEFAQTASAWAVAEGIVNGVKIDEDTTIFSPKTTATRAQVAAIIMRLMKGTGED